jgi:hypothetical protein
MVGRVAGTVVGMLLVAMTGAAAAQSLGDVARQEAARRGKMAAGTSKVLTNADLPASAVVGPGEAAAPADTATDAAKDAPEAAKAAVGTGTPAAAAAKDADTSAAKAAPAPTDDEAGWRARAERVNTALDGARMHVRQLKALSDRLSLESQASNPDIAARAQSERGDMRAQIALAEEKAAQAQAQRDALVLEARTAGVPPAWIQ